MSIYSSADLCFLVIVDYWVVPPIFVFQFVVVVGQGRHEDVPKFIANNRELLTGFKWLYFIIH